MLIIRGLDPAPTEAIDRTIWNNFHDWMEENDIVISISHSLDMTEGNRDENY